MSPGQSCDDGCSDDTGSRTRLVNGLKYSTPLAGGPCLSGNAFPFTGTAAPIRSFGLHQNPLAFLDPSYSRLCPTLANRSSNVLSGKAPHRSKLKHCSVTHEKHRCQHSTVQIIASPGWTLEFPPSNWYRGTPSNLDRPTDRQSASLRTLNPSNNDMRAFPTSALTRKALLLGGVLAHLAPLALALPQNQGTPSSNISTTLSAFTHLKPSLLHTPIYTPTVDIIQAERNGQNADITTETVISTVVIPTATELVTVVTTPSGGIPSASSTTSQPAEPSPDCVVQGGKDGGVCVTVVPIWPTDTLAPVMKRQASSSSSSSSISYKSTAYTVSLVTVYRTTLHPVVIQNGSRRAEHYLYLVWPAFGSSSNSSSITSDSDSDAACTPTDTFATITTSASTTTTFTKFTSPVAETSCTMPESLVNGHCTYNSMAGWNPAAEVPTERPDMDHRPPPPLTARARAVETGAFQGVAAEIGQSEQEGEGFRNNLHSGHEVRKRGIETNDWLVPLLMCLWFGALIVLAVWMVARILYKKKGKAGEAT